MGESGAVYHSGTAVASPGYGYDNVQYGHGDAYHGGGYHPYFGHSSTVVYHRGHYHHYIHHRAAWNEHLVDRPLRRALHSRLHRAILLLLSQEVRPDRSPLLGPTSQQLEPTAEAAPSIQRKARAL